MIDFKTVQEGILGNIDDTISKSDAAVKKLKDVSDIRKLIPVLSAIWDKLSDGPWGKKGTDFWSQDIKIGDVVLCEEGDTECSDMFFGIIVDGPIDNKFRIITTEARFAHGPENDPYRDCVSYMVDSNNIYRLACKKDAAQILKIIKNA